MVKKLIFIPNTAENHLCGPEELSVQKEQKESGG
jgi:hypothetical protein